MTPVRKPMSVPPIKPSKVICIVIFVPSRRLGMASQMTDHSKVTLIALRKMGADHVGIDVVQMKNGDPDVCIRRTAGSRSESLRAYLTFWPNHLVYRASYWPLSCKALSALLTVGTRSLPLGKAMP